MPRARKGEGRVPLTPEEQRKRAARSGRAMKIVVCVLVGIFLAVPALFVNSLIGYVALFAYLFALLLSYLYIRILRGSLEFSANAAGAECMRCEDIDFSLTVTNRSFLPAVRVEALFFMSDIFGGEGASDVHHITLGPHRDKTFDFGVRFDHIGSYQVGIKEVTVLDLFGIFSAKQVNDRLTEVNVLPRLFDVSDVPIARDAAIEAKKNFTTVINDGVDYSGVREYRWGDPIKAIHWKLSARMPVGDYYTRMYETNANPGMAIVADFDAPDYSVDDLMSVYDAVVECAFSLERYADANGFDAELLFEDKAKRRRRYVTPLMGRHQEILDRMPQIFSPGTGRDALGLIQDELQSVFAQSNLLVITSVITRELVQTMVAAKTGKRAPILFAVIPDGVDDDRRKELEKELVPLSAAGVSYTVLSAAASLGEGEVTR